MNQPLVSIIVPVYNMERFVEETLRSILASDYPNFEVVVMDDGSKDKSLEIVQRCAEEDGRIRVYSQENAGAGAARNHAIEKAKGKYILPVDADNLVAKDYVSKGVEVLENNPRVKVVSCQAEFFGNRTGEWPQPPFSLRLLARKNVIDNCAMYRRSDWEECGGYCARLRGREDWEFWLSMFERGGEFYRLPSVGFYYRVHENNKRVKTRRYKDELVDIVNERHPKFMQQQLGGPLRYHRSWSRVINGVARIFTIQHIVVNPDYKEHTEFINDIQFHFAKSGETIYHKRNIIKIFADAGREVVVKSFQLPIFINRMIYGVFRASKASRSYKYTLKLQKRGIGVPNAIGYIDTWHYGLYAKSYFINEKSGLRFKYNDIESCGEDKWEVLDAIGAFTAKMHEQRIYHKDYSGGNILFDKKDGAIAIELVDINRMDFGRVGLKKGCKNFERLEASPMMLIRMAKAYAKSRGFDEQTCIDKVLLYHYRYQQKKRCKGIAK